jgi:dihydroorotate dehydrogenase
MTIIGCGGIFSAQDAYDMVSHGANLLQLITGMIFQ